MIEQEKVSPSSLYILDQFLPGIKRKYIPYLIVLMMVLASLIFRLLFVSTIPLRIQALMVVVQYSFIFSLWYFCRYLNRLFNSFWPYSRKMLLRLLVQIVLTFIYYSIVRSLIFYLFVDYIPVRVPENFMVATYIVDFIISISLNIGFLAAYLLDKWKESWVREEQLVRENTQVQYDNLKNQLNPHFLFNSLTSLQSLIYKDQELATRFLQQLSKVYRYLLENRSRETVSLKREIEFVNHYIELLRTRFGNALQFKIAIGEEHFDKQIIPVSLQIMIENAIKHNQLSDEFPLIIRMEVQDSMLIVSNNLHKKLQVESSNGKGLNNFAQLYSFLSPVPVQWKSDAERFSIVIPLLNHA